MLSVWKNKTKKLSSINHSFKTESSLRPHLSILVFWFSFFRHAAEGQLEQIVKLMEKKKERKTPLQT